MAKKTRLTEKNEPDSIFILKIVLYLILGSMWLNIYTVSNDRIPIPLGALIALLFAATDHFKIDRKIEYAVLIVAAFVGYWVPIGFNIYLY
jgi:hypothetical protein